MTIPALNMGGASPFPGPAGPQPSAPALPFAGDTSKIHGYTISQWHQIAMNASRAVAQNPNDRNAHDALDYAHNAIQAYAGGRLHNKAVAGDVADEQSLDPGPLAANASHALNTATFGLANQVGGPNWRAFQNLGEEFQPSASARGDIVGGAVTAPLAGEAVGRVLAPAIRPVAQAIGAGFSPTAGAGAIAQSALGSGVALGVPSAVGGFFANPDASTGERLKTAAQEGAGGFILGTVTGGLGAYATRSARMAALERQASVAKAQQTLATAPEVAARAPLQTQIAQERATQAPLRTGIVQEQAQQAPMRTELLSRRLEDVQNNPGRPIQGQASAAEVGGGTSSVGAPVPDAGTTTGPEAQIRQHLAARGKSPAEIDAVVSALKKQGFTTMRPGLAPEVVPRGPGMGWTGLEGRTSPDATQTASIRPPAPSVAPAGVQSVGEAQMPGVALHDVSGNPIPGSVIPGPAFAPEQGPMQAARMPGSGGFVLRGPAAVDGLEALGGLNAQQNPALAVIKQAIQFPLDGQRAAQMAPILQSFGRQQARGLMAEIERSYGAGFVSAPWRDFLLTNLQKAGSAR